MRKTNPAVFECTKAVSTLHLWQRQPDGTVRCVACDLKLNREDTLDAFPELG